MQDLLHRVRSLGMGPDGRRTAADAYREAASAVIAHRMDRNALRCAARTRLMDLHADESADAAYAIGMLTAIIGLCDAQEAYHLRRKCETCGLGCRSVTTLVRYGVTVHRRLCHDCLGRLTAAGWRPAVVSTD